MRTCLVVGHGRSLGWWRLWFGDGCHSFAVRWLVTLFLVGRRYVGVGFIFH